MGRRGRPRGFDVEAVLDAALGVFWSKGFRPATTRELEQATGLSQSSMYNAFGSKQGLLEAALSHYEEAAYRQLLHPLERSVDGIGGITRFYDDLIAWIGRPDRRGCLLVNMMAEDGGVTPGLASRARAFRGRLRVTLLAALDRASELGEMRPDGRQSRADLLVGLVIGLDILARGGASSDELSALLSAVHCQIDGWRLTGGRLTEESCA